MSGKDKIIPTANRPKLEISENHNLTQWHREKNAENSECNIVYQYDSLDCSFTTYYPGYLFLRAAKHVKDLHFQTFYKALVLKAIPLHIQ